MRRRGCPPKHKWAVIVFLFVIYQYWSIFIKWSFKQQVFINISSAYQLTIWIHIKPCIWHKCNRKGSKSHKSSIFYILQQLSLIQFISVENNTSYTCTCLSVPKLMSSSAQSACRDNLSISLALYSYQSHSVSVLISPLEWKSSWVPSIFHKEGGNVKGFLSTSLVNSTLSLFTFNPLLFVPILMNSWSMFD